jgi:hypothetical protein
MRADTERGGKCGQGGRCGPAVHGTLADPHDQCAIVLAADAGTGRAGPDPDGNAHHLSVRPGQMAPAPASTPAAEAGARGGHFCRRVRAPPGLPIGRPTAPGSGPYAARREASSPDWDVGDREVERCPRTGRSRFKAVDTDDGWSEPLPDGRQMWREDAIQALLATEDADVLFVAGCEENQAQFHAQFDHIILLSAPLEGSGGRLATRTSNPYGKAPEELSRVVDDLQTVEPLLRQVADHEVRTTIPLNEVVTTILCLVDA